MTPLQHIIVSDIAAVFATVNLYSAVMALFKHKSFFVFAAETVITIMCLFFAIAHYLKAWW
jgi:hypothetical protein